MILWGTLCGWSNIGMVWLRLPSMGEGELKEMYEQSTLRKVASNCALELLWHWINEIRFDGPHSNDSMLMARAAVQVPGQHQMAPMSCAAQFVTNSRKCGTTSWNTSRKIDIILCSNLMLSQKSKKSSSLSCLNNLLNHF